MASLCMVGEVLRQCVGWRGEEGLGSVLTWLETPYFRIFRDFSFTQGFTFTQGGKMLIFRGHCPEGERDMKESGKCQ